MARPPPPPTAPVRPSIRARWIGAIFALVALGVYFPALNGDFLWDDGGHVTRPDLRSLDGLARIWTEVGATQQYYPLLHSAFWLQHQLWGDAVFGYHLSNVLQHALAAWLFGLLLRRLQVPGGWGAAALFLVHPVCVESVAWISEQKNTLSLVLYLCAALAYLRFAEKRTPSAYALATAAFLAALLTKTVTASLPAALLVVFWWQHGTLEFRRHILPLLPWFVLGTASGLFTAHFERELIGAQGEEFILSFADRLVLAGRVVWFYAANLIWPVNLTFIYPRWAIDAGVAWQWLFPAAAFALLGVLYARRDRSRAPLAVALLFGGSLFPVLGFFNVYPFIYSYVADHFQYLASLAVFAAAGAVWTWLALRLPTVARMALPGAILTLLGALTWLQAGTYRNAETLYRTTIARNPACWMAHNNLGILLVESGRAEQALPHYEQALRHRPRYAEAEHNYGLALNRLGRFTEALPRLERAVALRTGYAEAVNELGVALMGTGRLAEGQARFEQAVALRPDLGMARRNLGLALASAGRVPEALPHFQRATELLPTDPETHLQLATALYTLSRPSEALTPAQTALRLAPDSGPAHYTYALVLRALGRTTEASEHYRTAIAIDPRLAR